MAAALMDGPAPATPEPVRLTTRSALARATVAAAGGLLISVLAYELGWRWLVYGTGAYTALALEELGRELLASLRPATRSERRLASRVQSAVRQHQAGGG